MIRDAVQWLQELKEEKPDKKWLIVGKGPSSDMLSKVDVSRFNVVTLNHACRLVHADLAHFTDIEALDECESVLSDKAHNICMPWRPHVSMRPTTLTLMRYCGNNRAVLAEALRNDMLFSYNSSVARKHTKNAKLPNIRVRYFSAVAAFNLLAAAGIKLIHTIGVDGGTEYGRAFSDLKPLTNGRKSFDVQLQEFELTCQVEGCRHIDIGGLLCGS